MSVHPRACGEHCARVFAFSGYSGSSPRVRGTRFLLLAPLAPNRFIPARAGNTEPGMFSARLLPVHPRACGEHFSVIGLKLLSIGSSPRVRGTHITSALEPELLRFIPARAGNTALASPHGCLTTVHPRACGEHFDRRSCSWLPAGSSPRVRGTPRGEFIGAHVQRFIPARAGNTAFPRSRSQNPAVHPRACGEHGSGGDGAFLPIGSSPRVRGTLVSADELTAAVRFIPARAGNTFQAPPRAPEYTVHPRACGEHPAHAVFVFEYGGSSPRVRGTRQWGIFR